jgi:hypothetical protein
VRDAGDEEDEAVLALARRAAGPPGRRAAGHKG